MSQAVEAVAAAAEVELILHDEIGLDASTVGSSMIHRAVHRRMEKRGVGSIESYLRMLAADEQELQELIEQVVVPETYFFREPDAIAAIAPLAVERHRESSGAALRILSVPCSSGEEPYSIAMSLLAAGVPASVISIDAVDVSIEAVQRARAAVYRSGSFRGDMSAWKQYFTEGAHGLEVDERVRSLVQVVHGNLLSDGFQPPREQYDVIFCRNLLIYFDEGAQARALAKIALLLTPGGVLVVGSADSFAARRAGFAPSRGHERSFLFRAWTSTPQVERVVPITPRVRTRVMAVRTPTPPLVRQAPAKRAIASEKFVRPSAVASEGPILASVLAEVARLANDGQLEKAVDAGERAIRGGMISAALLSLVGTTYAAIPNLERAEECYRKALFLEPANEDALLHLALLLEKRGEGALASKLRSRARRALSFHTHVNP